MPLIMQRWQYYAIACGRCLSWARERDSYPVELGIKSGDIAATEWAYDAGWRDIHGENHCPACARACRGGQCPPRNLLNQAVLDANTQQEINE